MRVTLVTGNHNKLKEIQAIAPSNIKLVSRAVDLPEIQSLDLQAIIADKARSAYKIVKSPVIVEDVSAGLDDLAGLPGPFYKFFRQELGDTILVKLATIASNKVTIKCIAAFYDGKKLVLAQGVINGVAVEPRGTNGFGFDSVIMPNGESRTMAEMTPSEKNRISHRAQAFRELFQKI